MEELPVRSLSSVIALMIPALYDMLEICILFGQFDVSKKPRRKKTLRVGERN
jgi:hypothetical protein